jgi:uncharacterized protein YodC (DUF2158 family)
MQPGDIVQLKSGGPLMTIQSVDHTGITCTWFDDKHNLKTAEFLASMLEPYDEESPGGWGVS